MKLIEFLKNTEVREFSEQRIPEIIDILKKGRNKLMPNFSEIADQWDVYKHDIFHKIEQKYVAGKPVYTNYIPLAFQKKVVNTAVSFAFTNEPFLEVTGADTEVQKRAVQLIEGVFKKNRINSKNQEIYRELLKNTEVAEFWYLREAGVKHTDYSGIEFNGKLSIMVNRPTDGIRLYPYFDEYSNLIFFSREFTINEETIFEVYSDDDIYRFNSEKLAYEHRQNELGKIPVIYASQEATDWYDVQLAIERMEYLVSKFAQTNDYFASPIIFVNGNINNMPDKEESGKVIQGGPTSDAKYLSWDSAPEAIRLELENLYKFIHSFTQTPDFSFESVKGLGAISGIALEILLTDAKLKVLEKKNILDEYFDRRLSVVKAFISKIENNAEEINNITLSYNIQPFSIEDASANIERIATAINSGFISTETAVIEAGFNSDAIAEVEKIKEDRVTNISESYSL